MLYNRKKIKYRFPFDLGQYVQFGDLVGVITLIDDEIEFGVEAEFLDIREKLVVIYFNKDGSFKGQDSTERLKVKK